MIIVLSHKILSPRAVSLVPWCYAFDFLVINHIERLNIGGLMEVGGYNFGLEPYVTALGNATASREIFRVIDIKM